MIRIGISVEGATEEEFVKHLLTPFLCSKGVFVFPISLGGNVSTGRIVSELKKIYHKFDRLTTFYDFYGFKNNNAANADGLQGIIRGELRATLERNGHRLDDGKFYPYIQMYEFEGILFSDVSSFQIIPSVSDKHIAELRSVRDEFSSPEEINNGNDTAPSKRIKAIIREYSKVEHGPLIAQEIGLDHIREQCCRFDLWVKWLEEGGI